MEVITLVLGSAYRRWKGAHMSLIRQGFILTAAGFERILDRR